MVSLSYLVFRALNMETGDFCAIKQIDKALMSAKQLPGIKVSWIA